MDNGNPRYLYVLKAGQAGQPFNLLDKRHFMCCVMWKTNNFDQACFTVSTPKPTSIMTLKNAIFNEQQRLSWWAVSRRKHLLEQISLQLLINKRRGNGSSSYCLRSSSILSHYYYSENGAVNWRHVPLSGIRRLPRSFFVPSVGLIGVGVEVRSQSCLRRRKECALDVRHQGDHWIYNN